jgi:uncharacterized SAM-binding protein YcdF (DUF218 family)
MSQPRTSAARAASSFSTPWLSTLQQHRTQRRHLKTRDTRKGPEAAMPIEEAIRRVWDYHQLHHALTPAEAIFVLGSHDLRVAERAAELFHQKLAPLVICSGGFGNLTRNLFSEPEAELLARVLQKRGVPAAAILVENRSTNTGENVRFTRQLLAARGLDIHTVIAVQKPYMERRTYATIRQQWSEVNVQVTSPRLDFAAYCTTIPREDVINIMVGDLQRIILYPQRGFMIPQDVPAEVLRAFEVLKAAGYSRHLLTESA